MSRNSRLLEEQAKLEKQGYTGKVELHWFKGFCRFIDIPKKPVRVELTEVRINSLQEKKEEVT